MIALLAAVLLAQTPLIPRGLLLGNPERTNAKLSPDGKQLGWLAPDAKGVLQVWVKPLAGDKDAVAVTKDDQRPVRHYQWSEDSNVLLYLQDLAGDENFHLYAVDVSSLAVRDLTPFPGVRAAELETRGKCPDVAFISLNLRDRKQLDVHRVSLKTGVAELDTQNPGDVTRWVVDADCRVRGAVASLPDGGTELRLRDSAKAPWRSLIRAGLEETVSMLGFSLDGKSAFVTTSISTDTDRLVEKNLKTGSERLLAQNPRSDVRGVLLHPTRYTAQAVQFDIAGKPEWTLIETSIAKDFDGLKALGAGFPTLVSRDRADGLWVVLLTSDAAPRKFYLWDRAAKKGTLLFSVQPKLDAAPLQPLTPVAFKARDGLELNGYLARPAGEKKAGPMVLVVHGGPWAHDEWT